MRALATFALLLAGCATTGPSDRFVTPDHVSDDDPEVVHVDASPYSTMGSSGRTIAVERFETVAIGPVAGPTARKRPRKVGRRDIQLHNARLDNALRMIAREGKFNLVVQGELAKPVSIDLHSVEPYDAMLAIARANGVDVAYRGNIVIVGALDN